LPEVDLVASEAHCFAHPQPVSIHHQHQQMIARAVSTALRCLEQLFHFGIVEKILAALMRVGGLTHLQF
jgi:hypothetical protein